MISWKSKLKVLYKSLIVEFILVVALGYLQYSNLGFYSPLKSILLKV